MRSFGIPAQNLAHIAGVHYICMHAGRQLPLPGVPIDIALLSARLVHDIGKYGCRPEEAKRFPISLSTIPINILNGTVMPANCPYRSESFNLGSELENLFRRVLF